MSAVRGAARAWLLTCLCSAACGGDDGPEPRVDLDLDAGLSEGGSPHLDAGLRDAAANDAAATGDASDLLPPIPMATCELAGAAATGVSDMFISPDDPLAVAVRNDGALLSWAAFLKTKKQINAQWYAASGSDSVTVVPRDPLSNQGEPSSTTSSAGFVTVWGDDTSKAGVFNLRALAVSAAGVRLGEGPTVLTRYSSADRAPQLATGLDGNVLVVWQTLAPGVMGRSLVLSASGAPLGTSNDLPEYGASLGRPALARLNDGYVVAWVDATSARHVHLQRLDARGVPSGASSVVDGEGAAKGKVDIATTTSGGAVVFDVLVPGTVKGERAEVRLRTFDATGVLTGYERVITNDPDTGIVPSVVPLRGGYAVAYRSSVVGDHAVRLALVDRNGAVISSETIAPLVVDNLPLTLRISPDGSSMFAAWIDSVADTATFRVQRTWIHCD